MLGARIRAALIISTVVVASAAVVSAPNALADSSSPPSSSNGSPSPDAVASQQAQDSGKTVLVSADTDATSLTYANPDGSFSTKITEAPTRVDTSSGWKPINDSLQPDLGGDLTPTTSPVDVTVSGDGDGSLGELTVDGDSVGLGYSKDLPDPSVSGATASYTASSTAQVQVTATNTGFSQNVVLTAAPATAPVYTFPLHLNGLSAALKNGVLTLTNSSGDVVAVSNPLQMWDAQTDASGQPSNVAAVDAALVPTSDGDTALQLSPSMSFLSDPGTVYPVTVDPYLTATAPHGEDVTYSQDGTQDLFADSRLQVGNYPSGGSNDEQRAFIAFDVGQFIGRDVGTSTLTLYETNTGSCTAKTTNVYPTSGIATSPANWTTMATLNPFTASEWAEGDSFNAGAGCTGGANFVNLDVTEAATAWTTENPYTSGSTAPYAKGAGGLLLQAPSATDQTQAKTFCSMNYDTTPGDPCADQGSGTSRQPTLSVTWNTELGDQSWYTMTSHTLNDRSSLSVNTDDGNAVINAGDVHLKGIQQDLSLSRVYNSAGLDVPGQFGSNWVMTGGPDVQIVPTTPSVFGTDRMDYHGPGGTRFGRFVRDTASGHTYNYWAPHSGGLDADLVDNNNKTSTKHTWTLTFHSTQMTYLFDNFGNDNNPAVLINTTDRNGNSISYNYTSGVWTSVTDTEGRTLYICHTTAGYISSIQEGYTCGASQPTGDRLWSYSYSTSNPNQLTSYTDPTGATVNYGYSPTNPNQLITITDPAQANGVQPTTTITYSSGEVTTLAYQNDTAGDTYTYTYTYSSSPPSTCNEGTDNTPANYDTDVKDVTDGNHHTIYCFVDRDDFNNDAALTKGNRYVRVIDGDMHRRSSQYNPDQQSSTATSADNDGTTSSTVDSYSADNALQSVTEPANTGGDTGATGTATYPTSSGTGTATNGYQYQPSSSSDTEGDCTAYSYDTKGNLTDSYTGQSGGTCGTSGGQHNHIDYNLTSPNTTGTVKDTISPSGSATSADETTYSYYTSGSQKYMLQQIVRPGGNATCTTTRTLCTSYTYDTESRVATVTDGNGKTTTNSYDNDDRVTQTLFNGTTTCSTSAGTCITYAYDGEGNLTSRVDKSGTTSFGYDWLNRLTSETLPSGTTLAMTYDGANNMTSYTQTLSGQSADTVSYTYDAANKLTQIVDATGTYAVTNTNSGKRKTIVYPSSPAVTVGYTYNKAGNVTDIKPTGGSGLNELSYAYDHSGGQEQNNLYSVTVGTGSPTYYAYNGADQLTGTTGAGTNYSYTYDVDGNLKTSQAGSSSKVYNSYNEADELCWSGTASGTQMAQTCPSTTPTGDTTYSSDAAGNGTGTSSGPLVYNSLNQATSLEAPGGGPVSTQTYTDQGNDLRTAAGGTTFTNGPLGVTARSTYGGTTYYTRDPQGNIVGQHGNDGTAYYYSDRNNSTIALINTSGTAATTFSYDPYGTTTVTTQGTLHSPWRWDGGYEDTEGDNYYHFGARYYDQAGHFTQPDSIKGQASEPRTVDQYAYATGDPVNSADPTGRWSLSISGCVAYLCAQVNVGSSSSGGLAAGGGLGVSTGDDGSGEGFSASGTGSGDLESGPYAEASCSFGNTEAGVEATDSGTGGYVDATTPSSGECSGFVGGNT